MSGAAPRGPRGEALACLAPGKVNLCLLLGPVRADGLHELVSVVQSLSLADRVRLVAAGPGAERDEVHCPGVAGANIAAAALAAFRAATGWDGPWQRVEIDKRVPVAAGMGGGSGDAAAVLRLLSARAGVDDRALLMGIAAQLGADVPSQLEPGRTLVSGAGEEVVRVLDDSEPFGVLVLPSAGELATADVYAEADRLGLGRSRAELEAGLAAVERGLDAATGLAPEQLVNELEPAARSLEPSIDAALAEALGAGADVALVSGSGPTVAGLFLSSDGAARAERAVAAVHERDPPAVAATPVGAAFGQPTVAALRHN